MEKTYTHKGLEITVTLASVRAVARDFTYGPPAGYVAEVSICTAEPRRPIGVPIRLVMEDMRVFGTEDDDFATAFSAAKRVIDDKSAP